MKKTEMQTELLHFTCRYNHTLVIRLNPEIDTATLQRLVANDISLDLKVVGGLEAPTVSVLVPTPFTITQCENSAVPLRAPQTVTKADTALIRRERLAVEKECKRLGIHRDKFRLIQIEDEYGNASFLVDFIQHN